MRQRADKVRPNNGSFSPHGRDLPRETAAVDGRRRRSRIPRDERRDERREIYRARYSTFFCPLAILRVPRRSSAPLFTNEKSRATRLREASLIPNIVELWTEIRAR